jgi:hypothetical protein
MRKIASIQWGILSAVTTFIFFSMIIAGCNKENQKNRSHDQIIEEYKLSLFKDKDFIDNYLLDINITNLNKNKNLVIDDHKSNLLFESLKMIKSKEELSQLFTSYGYSNPIQLVTLFNLKASALYNIQQKYTYLSHFTKDELKNLFVYSYQRVILETITNEHLPGCLNSCCDTYVDSMSDCDIDFAIVTGVSILGGLASTIFGTPILGATAVTTGIGGAYLMHERCSATSARVYRQCMGYSK